MLASRSMLHVACCSTKWVSCSTDGRHILGLDFGGRGLKGTMPAADEWKFPKLQYLMLAFNNITGVVPALNFSRITGCGLGIEEACCYLTSTVSNVYDEEHDSGMTNVFDCPLPPGAAEDCHAVCKDSNGTLHGWGIDTGKRLRRLSVDEQLAERIRFLPKNVRASSKCQKCVPADPVEFPQCEVHKSLLFVNGHIEAAYCNADYLVVFSNAIPNHQVRLEEMPKPPGAGPQAGDFSVRVWNTQSYAFRVPLRPSYNADGSIKNYTGAGALAMMINGVSMYPIMSPGIAAIDEKHKWRDGHNRDDNMKLDGQLDSCNEHAGRGFDIHYHADPVCMYNDTKTGHSSVIGWAADGFPLYGKYAERTRPHARAPHYGYPCLMGLVRLVGATGTVRVTRSRPISTGATAISKIPTVMERRSTTTT